MVSTLRGSNPASTCAAPAGCDHHTGAGQQHERQRHLADDEQPARAEPTPPASLRPPSFSASFRSVRPARIAGSTPARMPVRYRHAEREQHHRRVDGDFVRARHLVREQRGAGGEADAREHRPTMPPAIASTSASMISCWKTRARPAPSAVRMATSLRRPSARANSRLPTLAQAISSTSADRGEQHHQRHHRCRRRAVPGAERPVRSSRCSSFGCSRSSRSEMSFISA